TDRFYSLKANQGTEIPSPSSAGAWIGTRRACVACSKLYPSDSSFGSLKARPKNDNPTGRLSPVNPAGTMRSGKPVRLAMSVAEIDHFGEGLRIPGSGVRQVLGDLRGEFRIPDRGVELPFGVEQPFRVPDVDDGRARLAHRRERRVDHPVHVGVGSKEVAGGADAR